MKNARADTITLYHAIVPAKEMTGKVLRKMKINHKCNRLFSFLFKGYAFFVGIKFLCLRTRTYSSFIVKSLLLRQTVPNKIRLLQIDTVYSLMWVYTVYESYGIFTLKLRVNFAVFTRLF